MQGKAALGRSYLLYDIGAKLVQGQWEYISHKLLTYNIYVWRCFFQNVLHNIVSKIVLTRENFVSAGKHARYKRLLLPERVLGHFCKFHSPTGFSVRPMRGRYTVVTRSSHDDASQRLCSSQWQHCRWIGCFQTSFARDTSEWRGCHSNPINNRRVAIALEFKAKNNAKISWCTSHTFMRATTLVLRAKTILWI